MKQTADDYLGEKVMTLITVPAWPMTPAAGDEGRGKIAGSTCWIINEPTAAALAYGLGTRRRTRRSPSSTGGTFDISILELGDGVFESSPRMETLTWGRISTSG